MKPEYCTHKINEQNAFEIVPVGVDYRRDKGRIRKPLPYAKTYLRACKLCTYAEKLDASQVHNKKAKEAV